MSEGGAAAVAWKAAWIWGPEERRPVNERIRFRRTFVWDGTEPARAELRVSADSRYRVWVNGEEIGGGPIRSTPGHWYYDAFDIRPSLRPGRNAIAVEVWHFGHSNYQYIEAEAGMIAQLDWEAGGRRGSIASGADWTWKRADAYERNTVKRNVNLGWMEMYDATREDEGWTTVGYDDRAWEAAVVVAPADGGAWGPLRARPIEPLAEVVLPPVAVTAIREVAPACQVVSVNMRDNFFPGERDANSRVFSGFLATALRTSAPLTRGTLTFAHTPWNGVQGRFKIGDAWLNAGDPIELPAGDHLFLMEIGAVHNDVISHMEWQLDPMPAFVHPLRADAPSPFATMGPFEAAQPRADGRTRIFGGVEKWTGLNPDLPQLAAVRECRTPAELAAFRDSLQDVPAERVMTNHMIYSLMQRKKELRRLPVDAAAERALYGRGTPGRLPSPTEGGDIEIILDFGKVYVGSLELELSAPEGTIVDAYGFEYIRPDESIYYTSGCNNAFRYRCRSGRQRFRSGTRMGLRYVMLTVRRPAGPVELFDVRLRQSSYPVTQANAFRCSDPLLNDIFEISRHTAHMCMEDTFVDCPTYEQVFWVGDCRISALVGYRAFGAYELARHCLEMVPRGRDQSPLLPALLPTDWQAAIPMWTFSWLIACKEYVDYSGDLDFAAGIYPEAAATLETYRGFLNDKGLLDTASWHLLDWAPLQLPSPGVVTAHQALLAYCHRLGAELAAAAGEPEASAALAAWESRLRAALRAELYDPEAKEYVDGLHRDGRFAATRSLQTHLLLYLTDCLSETEDAALVQALVEPPAHWQKIGTPFFNFYLFEALERLGRPELILERIREDWGRMLRHGATTTWETFGEPRSQAHAWSAGPAYMLPHLLLGVERTAPGFKRVRIAPPKTDLTWAKGFVPTPFGRIDCSWSREGERPAMRVEVPAAIDVDADEAVRNGEWSIEIVRL